MGNSGDFSRFTAAREQAGGGAQHSQKNSTKAALSSVSRLLGGGASRVAWSLMNVSLISLAGLLHCKALTSTTVDNLHQGMQPAAWANGRTGNRTEPSATPGSDRLGDPFASHCHLQSHVAVHCTTPGCTRHSLWKLHFDCRRPSCRLSCVKRIPVHTSPVSCTMHQSSSLSPNP